VAFIVPNIGAAGDLASEEGFLEAVVSRRNSYDVHAKAVRFEGSATNLNFRLDDLFDGPFPPTALLVAKPRDVVVILIHLQKRGLTVPHAISLIARDHDGIFESSISHYAFSAESYAQRLSRLMLQIGRQGYLAPKRHLIFPSYVDAGTVVQAPPDPS
jgi:DNA-binding LacI/PurR family transcriptional regulator